MGFVGARLGWVFPLVASSVLFIFVDFATGFCILVSLLVILSGISLEGLIREMSGSVGMPREDSKRLAVFVRSDCTVVGVAFVWAGGVDFSPRSLCIMVLYVC